MAGTFPPWNGLPWRDRWLPRDAENYVAALAQVSARMEQAIRRIAACLAAKNVIPPRFILGSHHQADAELRWIPSLLGQNPFVTAFVDKIGRGARRS